MFSGCAAVACGAIHRISLDIKVGLVGSEEAVEARDPFVVKITVFTLMRCIGSYTVPARHVLVYNFLVNSVHLVRNVHIDVTILENCWRIRFHTSLTNGAGFSTAWTWICSWDLTSRLKE